MKKIILSLLLIFSLVGTSFAAETATQFVNTLVDNVIQNVLKSDTSKEVKKARFESYVLSAVDVPAIAKTVLAQNWRTATKAEQDAFIDAFKTMAINMVAERFNMYNGQQLTFHSERPAQGKNQVFVDSSVPDSAGKPIQIVWRVKEKDGTYKVLDLIIEGVSMTLTYRNDYTAYLQKHTLKELIQQIEEQAAHPDSAHIPEQNAEPKKASAK